MLDAGRTQITASPVSKRLAKGKSLCAAGRRMMKNAWTLSTVPRAGLPWADEWIEGTAMEQSANLQLPYIMPSQAQKHVTHNEAIRSLDALVHLAVLDRDLFAPPASPADGDRYLVAAGATDAWAGKEGRCLVPAFDGSDRR